MPEPINQQVKFYADAPDGITVNKLCTYRVHDLDHSYDILNRFVNKGWKIRAAFHSFSSGTNIKLDISIVNGDLSATYSSKKTLDQKLDSWELENRKTLG